MKEENKQEIWANFDMDEFRGAVLFSCRQCNHAWKIQKRQDESIAHSDWLPLLNHARKHQAEN